MKPGLTKLNTQALRLIALSLSIATLTSACGKAENLRDVGAFEPYVVKFEEEAQARGVGLKVDNLAIRFGATQPGERGYCEVVGEQTPTIIVNSSSWTRSTEAEREELMFHEMGHCVLGRAHDSDIGDDGLPKSLMFPMKLSDAVYSPTRERYLDELFAP